MIACNVIDSYYEKADVSMPTIIYKHKPGHWGNFFI